MQSTIQSEGRPEGGESRLVRRLAFAATGLLLAGAVYLIVVRGEAIIVDLATLAGQVWCF